MRDRSNQLMGFTNQLRTGGGNQMDCVWKSRIPSNGNGHASYILGKLTPGENPFKIWGYVPYCQTNWTEIEKTRLHSVISSIILYIYIFAQHINATIEVCKMTQNGIDVLHGPIYIYIYVYQKPNFSSTTMGLLSWQQCWHIPLLGHIRL